MTLFKKKIKAKDIPAVAPEEPETQEEIAYTEELDEEDGKAPAAEAPSSVPEREYTEVPVYLSQAHINNMVIENNLMLKQIIAEM